MERFDLVVVGGSAAGMAAAIRAAELCPRQRILLLEKLPRVGKKLLATGNGRCNLTNLQAGPDAYYHGRFAASVLAACPPQAVTAFFAAHGLRCYADDAGRVYPRSNVAASVVDTLRYALADAGVEVRCETPVTNIRRSGRGFVLNDAVEADTVILALGGQAAPVHGSDGGGYRLARQLGLSVTPLVPALVPLIAADGATAALKGVRARNAALTLQSGGRVLTSADGELLFTARGLSGIAAMELAADAQTALKSDKDNTFTVIDFVPELTADELKACLLETAHIKENQQIEQLLTGLLPKAIGMHICKAEKLYKQEERIGALRPAQLESLAETVKAFPVRLAGVGSFSEAQVTRGGVAVEEIDPVSLQSLRCPGLYFAGELIDVDGPCGGYNLQWAFASGLTAGERKGTVNAQNQ
ncbi:MAG: aminoacetone oxidase family FAD-binding enzyme [Clostridia bacterium]|nr:aminoacetone oxidase family FAD-binding enzyme [Clostridia bacterium]